jgi:surface antigen
VSRLVRNVATLACMLLVSSLGVTSAPAPASASSTLLCTGYARCAKAGMGNGGYKAVSGTMWWRMYSGHNCTNYVAYRMVHSGLPNVRPWSGGGNATYWGGSNPRITNSVPAVGSVAWWRADTGPGGSSGHVAYVERVVSADQIIVSQDSWGGDFSWARIIRGGGSWPSGFIHFNDVPLTNTSKPIVSGLPKVGAVLSASPGRWTPSRATYAYQWRANGVAIADATGSTLTLRLAQKGKRISVRTTATELGYPTTSAVSAATTAVLPGEITNNVQPTVSGDAVVDSTLTASPGAWTPTPSAFAYHWSADGTPIAGATAATLTPGADLVGKVISVTVTASKDGYTKVSSSSASTLPVARATFTMTGTPTLTGDPLLGETLSLDPGTFTPADAEVTVHWLRDGVPVAGSAGSTYLLTKADLGTHVRAQMTLTRPGYETLTVRTTRTWLVKSVSTLRVAAHAHTGRLSVDVAVTAPGVTYVRGTVVMKSENGRILKTASLRRGAATITLTGLPRGRVTYAFRYLGSDTATPTVRLTRSVWIP